MPYSCVDKVYRLTPYSPHMLACSLTLQVLLIVGGVTDARRLSAQVRYA
jgi:hypothetical protein